MAMEFVWSCLGGNMLKSALQLDGKISCKVILMVVMHELIAGYKKIVSTVEV